jgi:uncharacterized membrane protein
LPISASNNNADTHQIVVRPNASLTPGGAILFFACVSIVSLGIAIRFMLLGLWMIMPFALLELALLGACILYILRRNDRMEAIDVDRHRLTLIQKEHGRERRQQFQRYWVQIIREKGPHAWYPSRLLLRSHGKSVEIASFLDEEERQQLEQNLRMAIATG